MSGLGLLAELTGRAAFVLAAVWALDTLLRRRGVAAAARHWLWTLALAVVAALPLLALTLPDVGIPLLPADEPVAAIEPATLPASATAATAAATGASAVEALPATREWAMPALAPVLVGIWLAGALLLLLRLSGQLFLLRRFTARAAAPPAVVERIVDGLWRNRRPLRIRVSDEIKTPLTFGLFRPVILLPAEARAWPADRLRIVLLHELAHVQRADQASNLIAQLASALSWHLPLTWVAAWRLRLAREMACDDWVLRHGELEEDYASHLIAIVRELPRHAPIESGALCMAQDDLKLRLRAILDLDRPRGSLAPRPMLCSAVVIAALAWPLASVQLEPRSPFDLSDPVAASRDDNPAVRVAAAAKLGQQGDNTSLFRLMGMLDDDALAVRLASLRALENRGERKSFYDVLPHRNDAEPEARVATLETLGAIGCEPAFIAIASSLDDPDPRVRETAARSLSRFERRLLAQPLSNLFSVQHPTSKRDLRRTVGLPLDATAVELLQATLSDATPDVREAARATLDRQGFR